MSEQKISKFEGAKELARTLLEKVSQSDAGKIAVFAVFTGTVYSAYKLTLGAMNNNNTTIDNQ